MVFRRILPLGALVAAALALTACAGPAGGSGASDDSSGSASGDPLVVYNAQHEQLTQEWADEFTAETGIEVVLRNGDGTELSNQLVQEGAASKADLFLTENSPAMAAVDRAGLFAPVDEQTLEAVPEQFRPADGHWIGIAARSTVMVYNPELLPESELPGSIMDLQKPEWKGRWAGAPGKADFQAIVSAILETQGEAATLDWLEGMAENASSLRNNIVTMKAVNDGEVPAGIIFHYYWFRDQDDAGEDSGNTRLHYFDQGDPGAFVSISGGGVLKNGAHQDEAQQFLAFIVGKRGQEILGTGYSFEYPVASGVAANPALPPLAELGAPEIDPEKLNGPEVVDLMTQAGLL